MSSGTKNNEAYLFFTEVSTVDLLCKTLMGKILPDNVHPSHFAIVLYLARLGDGKTPQQLASAMEVTKATMSHSLKVLEKRGFVQILKSEADARSKQVFLTEAGSNFYNQAMAASARTFGNFLREEHLQLMADALPYLVAIRKLLDENREPVRDD